MEQILPEH